MSCIAGLAGSPAAPEARQAQMDRMLSSMIGRAPHGLSHRDLGRVTLGHALLATSAGDRAPEWPLTLDGRHWIVADARVDGRAALIDRLRSRGRAVSQDAPHAALILHAYAEFGDAFLDHLLGDFAFALWDSPAQRLVCARDHFGVRPFLYATRGDELAFASDVGALHRMAWVSDQLDRTSLVDFLMFGVPLEASRTAFRDVRCLPPASRLVWQDGKVMVDRYWTLQPPPDPKGWRMSRMAGEFLHVFSQAVRDRLPDGPVGCELSGGMDSSAIAAVAAREIAGGARAVTAYTHDLSRLEPRDEEGRLAGEIARALGIDWVCQDMARFRLLGPLQADAAPPREPVAYPLLEAHRENLADAGRRGIHVMLSGDHGDAVLAPPVGYVARLCADGRWGRVGAEAARHLLLTGGLSGLGLRSALRPQAPPAPWEPVRPDWIIPPPEGSVDPARRWRLGWDQLSGDLGAAGQLNRSWIARTAGTSECLQLPIVFRYPFLDLRVVTLALQLPIGALAGKRVLRLALRGRLARTVLSRPKTPAPGDYMRTLAGLDGAGLAPPALPALSALGVVDVTAWQAGWRAWASGAGTESTWSSHLVLAPKALESWIIGRTEEDAHARQGLT